MGTHFKIQGHRPLKTSSYFTLDARCGQQKEFTNSRSSERSKHFLFRLSNLGNLRPSALEPAPKLCSHRENPEPRGFSSACCKPQPSDEFHKEKIMSKVPHIPQGYNTVMPYLIVKGAAQAIDYYKKVFGATEVMRMEQPGGKIGHAELKIGNSVIMLADENPNMGQGYASAATIGASPVSLYVYLPDVDRVVERAVAAGAKTLKPVQDQFYGDRSGFIQDPFGHLWGVATHVEDVSPEEMAERAKKVMQAA
jgi:PhnB protein